VKQAIVPPQPYYPQVDKSVPAQVTVHLQRLYTTANDHDAAIVLLKSQLDKVATASAASTTTYLAVASETVTGGTGTQTIGLVNNQTGATSYATQQSDYGALIVLNDASPIAVTLTAAPVITLPWYATFLNLGTGMVTFTPASGSLNGGSTLPPNGFVSISFDGTNFWLGPPPVVFTRGGTILTPTGPVNAIVWYAPFSATVTHVLGYTDGSTGSVINARRNGTLPLLVSNLTLSAADTWTDGGAVQNTAIGVGDKLEIMVVSVSGAPTEIAVEVQCTRP